MIIKIDEAAMDRYNFNFEKVIASLIKTIPSEHIRGLGKIWVTDTWYGKEEKNAYGFYSGIREGVSTPVVIINASNLFKGIPKFVFYCIPIIPKLLFAKIFYHEIAHHFQRLRHGVKKNIWETDAEYYAKKMMLKNFNNTIRTLSFLLEPLFILFKIKRNGKINKEK